MEATIQLGGREVIVDAGTVLEGVRPYRTEVNNEGKKIYVYRPCKDVKGLLFPNDERVNLGELQNVILTGMSQKQGVTILFSEVYHTDEELLRSTFEVKISGTARNLPGFRLKGWQGYYLGSVFRGDLKMGEWAVVATRKIFELDNGNKLLKVDLVSRL